MLVYKFRSRLYEYQISDFEVNSIEMFKILILNFYTYNECLIYLLQNIYMYNSIYKNILILSCITWN